MSDTETLNLLSSDALLTKAYAKLNTSAEGRITELRKKMEVLPSVLDTDTLSKLRNGDYGISLREYTNLNTYNNLMTVKYGDKSANSFQSLLNNYLQTDDDKLANAKSFIDKMRENGVSNSSALKLYSALQSYSLVSSFKNYNFVNAKV
ncbi:hypothetical protein IKQ21_01075 [bacterium]|nr:hypothetical protein [bacterium]